MRKASERAVAGGGREVTLPSPSYSVGPLGTTYGNGSGSGAGWFGPGQPMSPQAPEAVKGRAFDFPQGVNLLTTTRPYEAFSYQTLRAFADGYDLLRLIIETRKDAMERLRWVIQPRDSKEKLTPQRRNKMKALTAFFLKPDQEHSWNAWLRMLLEDLFVIDAVTLHRRRTRGGKLISLDQLDGATIRRCLDDWGRTPEDPNDTAYQQILKGMPAVDYRKSELFFCPRNIRVHKIYGYSPVEQIMMTVNIGLRRQVFQLNFFTEGNIPAALVGVPDEWTPDQIKTFQEWFDNIYSGNLAEKRKARFVPNAVGKTYHPTQETELFGTADEWLARVTCFAFSISPQPFIKMMNRATAENASREAEANGLAPIQNWVKDLIDSVLSEDLDAADFEFIWKGDDELDPAKRQTITSGYLKDGLLTINEGRSDMGREPYDDPQYDKPMFMTSNGFAPLTLTADAQGGDDTAGRSNQDSPTDDSDVSPVTKNLLMLTQLGDPDVLAAYLQKVIQGEGDE